MSEKARKRVLIVDDEPLMCEILLDRFRECAGNPDSPYEFDADVANSAAECVERIRAAGPGAGSAPYDVVVLDIRMEGERSGLEASFALQQQQGAESPVRIICTGYPSYRDCVEATRNGAWDYIVKEDVAETPLAQRVVNSAVVRLRQFDLRREQESLIASGWLPLNILDLQARHAGKLVALWHAPEVRVIASGRDAFELESELKDWGKGREAWERPFVVQVPPPHDGYEEED
jgi:CheY-like chemotaxis protein